LLPLSLSAALFRTSDLLRDHGISHSSYHPHYGPMSSALTLSFRLLLAITRDSPYTSILPPFALLTTHSLLWFTSHASSIIHCQAVDLLLLCPFGVLVFLRAICFLSHPLIHSESMLLGYLSLSMSVSCVWCTVG
jgi:hypothetical protein